jgi:flagellar motor switch protein FliG
LVLALVKAEESLKERLLGNMSKRARQTILDELEFKTNASEDEVKEGEKEIVGVLMKMEEEGEISLG